MQSQLLSEMAYTDEIQNTLVTQVLLHGLKVSGGSTTLQDVTIASRYTRTSAMSPQIHINHPIGAYVALYTYFKQLKTFS